jgi:hypothetical protein
LVRDDLARSLESLSGTGRRISSKKLGINVLAGAVRVDGGLVLGTTRLDLESDTLGLEGIFDVDRVLAAGHFGKESERDVCWGECGIGGRRPVT